MTAKHHQPINSDASHCPICGEANHCMMIEAEAPKDCWCMSAQFPDKLLERIPETAKKRCCICQTCLQKSHI